MPPIRSLASKCCAYVVLVIFLLSEIMPTCSRYTEKKLVYIIIIAPSSHQPSSCFECTKSNIYSSCNVRLVLDTDLTLQNKYIFNLVYLI